ncbi:hypothetical protein H8356DRAFT_1750283 [Neocallimastix lanati (nom. inval.)]|jgi:hypothetical protein|nr:hypothetical protein H8356DRAFT_1750283 [Neocallimastix sp. JGI-2020a]
MRLNITIIFLYLAFVLVKVSANCLPTTKRLPAKTIPNSILKRYYNSCEANGGTLTSTKRGCVMSTICVYGTVRKPTTTKIVLPPKTTLSSITLPPSTVSLPTKKVTTTTTTTTTNSLIPVTSSKCIPVFVTVTEKEEITITQKETITVTVEEGPTNVVDDSKCGSQWTQCGGIGYNGETCCKSGLTCKEVSKYYSQCVKV